ncbi:MAG: hypothetical protein OXN89_14210 [Bryobacterales bacterium]|nr:hypothetical protein [Bryobacterales bacterium]
MTELERQFTAVVKRSFAQGERRQQRVEQQSGHVTSLIKRSRTLGETFR